MKILIFGLPGSGKTTLAKPFAELIGGVHINGDDVRKHYEDSDFSIAGRIKQAERMRHLADGVVMAGKVAIIDFVCPLELTRDKIQADYKVWMDTIEKGRYNDTNIIFQKPESVNYRVDEWFNDTHSQLADVVSNYMRKKENSKEKL